MIITIFILTCTSSFTDLKESGSVHFQWEGNPSLNELLLPWPSFINSDFAVQKAGHALAFFILTGGLLRLTSLSFAAVISALYAMATEILQLYFMRSGRLLDVMVDCGGIFLALLVFGLIKAAAGQSSQQKGVSRN